MVDILEASGANKPKVGTIATPTSTVSAAQMAAPGVEMGQALRGLGQAADRIFDQVDAAGVPAAQAAGLAAVGRDENGQPTVELRPFAITKSDAAFNAAATQGFLSQYQMEAARGLQEIAAKHPVDATAFDAEAKKFIQTVGKGAKDLRPVVLAEGEKLRQQHFLTISNKAVAVQTQNALTSITTQIEDQQNTLFALARKGGGETPEAQDALARISGLYNQLEKNPAFGYPAARVSSEVEKIKSLMIGEGIVGEVDRTYTKRGKADAQKYLTDSILNNEKLNLSNAQRSSLYSTGMARLQYLDGETKAAVAAHRTTVNSIVSGLQAKVQVPDSEIDGAIDKAQQLGDAESVLKLNAARSVASLRRAGAGLTEEQEVRLFAGIGSGQPTYSPPAGQTQARIYGRLLQGGLTPVMAFGLMGNLSMESSFNTGARNPGDGRDGSDSIGLAQWNSDRARALSAFAAARGKPVTDVDTQADFIIHELNTTEGRARAALASARTPEEAGRAAIGYFRPAGFSWANPEGAHNSGQRIRQASILAGTLPGAAAENGQARGAPNAASPFTPEQLRANPFLGSEWIKSQVADQKETIQTASRVADAISSGIDKGVLPSPETFAAFLQMASQFPDQLGKARDDLIAKAKGYDDALVALGEPSAAGAAMVADAQMRAQGAPILVQQRAAAMKASYEQGEKALAEQPWTEAARRGWSAGALPALDFSSAQALQQGLAARSEVASSISARTGQPQSLLSKDDIAAVQGVFRNGTPDQRSMVAAALGRMPDEPFAQAIVDKEMKDSLIGMSRSGDPSKMATAFSVMDRAKRTNPDLFHQVYGKEMENRLAAWASRQSYLSPQELAKEMAKENDPATQKARELMREDALKKVEKLTPGDIAGYFDTSYLPFTAPAPPVQTDRGEASRFANEYRREFAETYAAVGGDESKARDLAVERLARVWAPSALNNGALMKFAPEKAYPTIGGSHDWLVKQFDQAVRETVAAMGGRAFEDGGASVLSDPAWVERPGATNMLSAKRMLVPDARTEAEFNSGRAPSYLVSVLAPNGMYVPLENAQGQVMRFFADADAEIAQRRAAAMTQFEGSQEAFASQERFEADAARRAAGRRARRQEPR